MYWYNWFSQWWAHGCSKHVEYRHKHTGKRTVRQVGYLQEAFGNSTLHAIRHKFLCCRKQSYPKRLEAQSKWCSGWFMIVQQQACLNGCCTAMWKENREIIILLHFPDSFFSKTQRTDYLKDTRQYWKLKEEPLDHSLWRTCFGRGDGPVVRLTTEWMNDSTFKMGIPFMG